MKPTHPDLLRVREAADLLGIHQQTLYKCLKSGTIPGQRIGHQWRLWRPAVQAILEGRSVEEVKVCLDEIK